MKDKQGQLSTRTDCRLYFIGREGWSSFELIWIHRGFDFHCMLIFLNSPNNLQISLFSSHGL